MALPIVAIVGRPNVGKSSLLNCLAGKRISIVDPTPGVTRDRVTYTLEHEGRFFELVDTGGYGIVDRDDLGAEVEAQIAGALEEASLVLFVVDVRDGILPLDQQVAGMLRRRKKPVLVAANKADSDLLAAEAGVFSRLGFGQAMVISAISGHGRSDLLDAIGEQLAHLPAEEPQKAVMKLAMVGKRNAGKSTFINSLAGSQRVIVSSIPGTTRDSVDVRFEMAGRAFIAIDTAGMLKMSAARNDPIAFHAYGRAQRAIRRADVVLLLIDATDPVGQVDKRLAAYVAEQFKPAVLVVNKWDLARGRATTEDFHAYIEKTLPGILTEAPIAFTTATEAKNLQTVIDTAQTLFNQARTRLGTGQLNQVLAEILARRGPSQKRGAKRPKVYFATQVAVAPPTIVLSVNDPAAFTADYRRYLLNRFHETLPFAEVPIRLLLQGHHGKRG
jgi:GTP-binding protein